MISGSTGPWLQSTAVLRARDALADDRARHRTSPSSQASWLMSRCFVDLAGRVPPASGATVLHAARRRAAR